MRLKDKVIIVTGSTTGIGRAIAKKAVSEGAKVVVHGLEEDLGAQVVLELGEENAVLLIEDISDDGAPDRLVELAIRKWGRLDSVVNNAAIVAASTITDTDKDFISRILGVNTIAPCLLIQAALPYLIESRGAVLNIGSINAWGGEHNLLAYSISKGALMTMTRNLGDSLFREKGVRVNQINPGWVLTENEVARKKTHGLSDDWHENLPKVYAPAGRLIYAEEIAVAVVYWLSDESGPISGQVVDLEQYPMIGRNVPKDANTIPHK
ncbi:NAD(P)-dependent dehydrogenase, short-chain alcohol dehydrogenase family [Algoriphagus locisalis]|uniref:NAD(P)-dependent dehydrogenase, short-chain alcohol dehydrogenase family n=1 Tax=Algoriphagus locisalis TaxID=305507 RepID=A0A1I7ACM8_9BACT|nr:SDR family oxidoreductase [Algoriphagus locisalis]SFT72590.1 NAD(P)-dependent dehydrogenase, short-chain alcohol dehydrogenase family [Algoriphagus locisalis]